MNSNRFKRFYLFACLGVLVASFYPLYMGVRVIRDMIVNGIVMKENYPKYIIPYTPICIAILIGIILLPLFVRLFKRYAFFGGAALSIGAFFGLEALFERNVVVRAEETVTTLEDWQMFMCYTVREGAGEAVTTYRTETPVDILMGNYNPAFKLHFYVISVVLILTLLNCLYGFAQTGTTGSKKRLKALVLQFVSSIVFLGLCILACFTAFWRDRSILVSPLSAALMSVFFIILGVSVGIFAGSFLLGKRRIVSIGVPTIVSTLMTLLMYIGEMILLHGNLYQYGSGAFFKGLPLIILAPVDILIILLSGAVCAVVFCLLNKKERALCRQCD